MHVHSHTECMSVLVQSDVIAVQVSSSGDETTSMNTAHRALVETPINRSAGNLLNILFAFDFKTWHGLVLA